MTELEAANRALMALGVETITSLSADTKPARVMSALMHNTKPLVLNEFPWTFALALKTYTQSDTGTSPLADFACSVPYPAGALNVRSVVDGVTGRPAPFRVVGSSILTDAASGVIEYTANVSALSSWPQQVAECLVLRLASDAAAALTGSVQFASAMLDRYMMMARYAAQTSAVEERTPFAAPTDYIDARR